MITKGIKEIKNSLIMLKMKMFFIMICCACLGCSQISPAPQDQSSVSDGIRIIGEQKSKCEQWAKKVKSDYAKNTKQYQEVNSLYIDAKAAFDGWIDQFKFDITANTDINGSTRYKESLLMASEKSEVF